MKKLAAVLAVLLLSAGCSARTGAEPKGPDTPAPQVQGAQEDSASSKAGIPQAEEPANAVPGRGESPGGEPAADPGESAADPPDAGFSEGMSAEELMRHGTVGEDGLSYRNDALGLQLNLPASSTGRPWHFVQKAAEDGPGIGISVCYDENEETGIIHISAVTQEAYRQIAENDYPHTLMGSNSRWAFLFSVSNGVPEGIEGTVQEEVYTTMRREARDWEAEGRTVIEEPSIP